MWGLVAGIVGYFPLAWYTHRRLDSFGVPPGTGRKLVVFAIATALSTALGDGVSFLTTSPAQRTREAAVHQQTLKLLAGTLACSRNPDAPSCQKEAASAHSLMAQVLGEEETPPPRH